MSLSKIINNAYQGQAADLINGNPTGPVQGYQVNPSKNQSWEVVVTGGNHITIRNATTGTYASVASEAAGVSVVGNATPYTWQQLSVTGGWYQFATLDGKYVWLLTGSQNFAPIQLKATPYQGSDAQWGYENAARVQ